MALMIAFLEGWDVSQAASVTLTPSADTALFEKYPSYNFGAATLAAGSTADGFYSRALIQFDVASQIPSNAMITSVSLTLTVVQAPRPDVAEGSDFDLHRVHRSWGEGDKDGLTGGIARTGEASWFHRFYPLTSWELPGAAEGTEYSSTVSASSPISVVGRYTFNSTAEFIADVQKWLTDPSSNFGWILISRLEGNIATGRRFGPREDPENTPVLQVEYELPFTGVRIAHSERGGNQFTLYFTAEPARSYAVEFRNAAAEGPWTTLTNITVGFLTTNAAASDSLSASPQRFYRIVEFGGVR